MIDYINLREAIEHIDAILLHKWEWSESDQEERFFLDLSSDLFCLKNKLQRKGLWNNDR